MIRFPAHWRLSTIGGITQGGGMLKSGISTRVRDEAGVPLILPENISENRIEPTGIIRVAPAVAAANRIHQLKAGDIVCSRRGTLNRRAVASSDHEGWLCGVGCLHLRPGDSVDSRYLYYYLAHPAVKEWIRSHAVGSTMPHIGKQTFTSLPVLLPPKDEQIEIASSLALLEEKMLLNERMNESLERCAQGIISETLSGSSHETATLQSVALRLENGRTPARNVPEYWLPAEIPWLQSHELHRTIVTGTSESISEAGLRRCYLKTWPKGTIVIALYGTLAGTVGMLDIEAAANQGCCGLLMPPAWQAYTYFYLRMSMQALQMRKKGSVQQNLNQQAIGAFRIPVLQAAQLDKLSSKLGVLLQKIRSNVHESRTLKDLSHHMLNALFSPENPNHGNRHELA